MAKFKYIDLFCGIGGFHQAMTRLDGRCVFASDIDLDCRKTYEKNYGIIPEGDITQIKVEKIPQFDVLCAGFPCQAFSKAGKRLGFVDKTKGTLFFDICRIITYHKPKFILLNRKVYKIFELLSQRDYLYMYFARLIIIHLLTILANFSESKLITN